jgi:hypothetical protein
MHYMSAVGATIVATTQINFDKLAYIDRLKAGGIEEQAARAHAEALDQALREEVATKHDLEIAVRDLKIWIGGIAILLFGALASIKYFG